VSLTRLEGEIVRTLPKPHVSDSTRNQFKARELWLTSQESSEIGHALTPMRSCIETTGPEHIPSQPVYTDLR
jgi:hypothetical protein